MDFLILWKAYSSPKRIISGLPSPGSNRDHFLQADLSVLICSMPIWINGGGMAPSYLIDFTVGWSFGERQHSSV
jgi:hypothetical protein